MILKNKAVSSTLKYVYFQVMGELQVILARDGSANQGVFNIDFIGEEYYIRLGEGFKKKLTNAEQLQGGLLMRQKKSSLTGGLGFIGSHLVENFPGKIRY